MIKFRFSKGSDYNNSPSQLYVVFGAGKGYMNKFWVNLNKGPGNAVKPNTPCGHTGIDRCNSCHCTRKFCNLPRKPIIGFFLHGHTLTLWAGAPFYKNEKLKRWLKNTKLSFHHTKQLVSFR